MKKVLGKKSQTKGNPGVSPSSPEGLWDRCIWLSGGPLFRESPRWMQIAIRKLIAEARTTSNDNEVDTQPQALELPFMVERNSLGHEIQDFLSQHGKRDANNSSEWNSPDAGQMESTYQQLLGDVPLKNIQVPFSEFGSGGYKPYNDENARRWHDSLIKQVKDLVSLAV
jgi:hypothetical protein